jgi:hypothetical protein
MDDTDRRGFLTTLSAVGVAGVAGCPGESGSSTASGGVSTTAATASRTTETQARTTTEESTETSPPVSEWETTVGDDGGNALWNWTAGVDGGYLLTGETSEDADDGDRHALRLKVDDSGGTVWSRVGDADGWNWNFGTLRTADGYVVAGVRALDPDSDEQGYQTVVREYDAGGDRRWETRLGGADANTQVDGLLPGVDGGYLAYSRQDDGTGGMDAAIRKLDADGTEAWSREFGTGDYDAFWRGLTVADGYVFAGEYAGADGYVLKTDAEGTEQWTYTPAGEEGSRFEGLAAADDGFLAVGATADGGDGWAVKLTADGTEEWSETYDAETESWLNDAVAHDEGYYLVGRTAEGTDDDNDAWVVEIDADGEQVDETTDGGDGEDALYSIEGTVDGGYLAVGWTAPDGETGPLGWALKVADPVAGIGE